VTDKHLHHPKCLARRNVWYTCTCEEKRAEDTLRPYAKPHIQSCKLDTGLKAEVFEWQKKIFPHADAASVSAHLKEEAGELYDHFWHQDEIKGTCTVHLTRDCACPEETRSADGRGRRKTLKLTEEGLPIDVKRQAIAEEMADVRILLYALEGLLDIDLDTEVVKKLEKKNKTRQWGEPDAQGVVRHVGKA
jgi:NTP pyrophosphatase (non-canonical NTP hydrolase)